MTWGDPRDGGDSRQVQDKLWNVQQIQATAGAFAAILESGAVVTSGDPVYGGTFCAFAATLESGAVVTWGDPHVGGNSSQVQDLSKVQNPSTAILECGAVVSWGDPQAGGDSSQLTNVQHIQARLLPFLHLGL